MWKGRLIQPSAAKHLVGPVAHNGWSAGSTMGSQRARQCGVGGTQRGWTAGLTRLRCMHSRARFPQQLLCELNHLGRKMHHVRASV